MVGEQSGDLSDECTYYGKSCQYRFQVPDRDWLLERAIQSRLGVSLADSDTRLCDRLSIES